MVKLGSHIEKKLEEMEQKILGALDKLNPTVGSEKKLNDKITRMESTVIEQIKIHQDNVEASLKKQESAVSAMPTYTEELKSRTQELKDLMTAKDDKALRERNVILHNIPESTSEDPEKRKKYDKDSFDNVVRALFGESELIEVENVFRIGKKQEIRENEVYTPKPRLMLIKLKEKVNVDVLFKNRMKLKDRGFPNVYITRDLPPEERETQKRLRQEWMEKGKESHMIFRGKVILRK